MADLNEEMWAYDLSTEIFSVGEVKNYDAIEIALENIVMTLVGERVFLPTYGTYVPVSVFESARGYKESIINSIVKAVNDWDQRILIDVEQSDIRFLGNNSVEILVYYSVSGSGISRPMRRVLEA